MDLITGPFLPVSGQCSVSPISAPDFHLEPCHIFITIFQPNWPK